MKARHAPVGQPLESEGLPYARLRGRRLAFVQAAWVAVVALIIGLFLVSLPAGFEYFGSVCADAVCDGPQLSPEKARALQDLGFSLGSYAAYFSALIVGFAIVFFVASAQIFWRKSDDLMSLYVSLFLVGLGAVSPPNLDAFVETHPSWWLPVRLMTVFNVAFIFLFFFLFPTGRFVPRWTRWVAIVGTLLMAPPIFVPALDTRYPLLFVLYFLGLFGVCVFAQVYRYRRVSGFTERRQTKWVVFGSAAALAGFAGLIAISLSAPRIGLVADIALNTGIYLFMLLIPLSLGVAILRHQLFDIDLVINRTLVYGALTALVVGIYVLVVGYLGALFRTGGDLLISVVAAGLVAVLFQPLRERLQRGVNRLIYGERDDPYAVISQLGERLEATLEPEAVLPTVARTVREALKLPYAAVALGKGDGVVAESGSPVDDPVRLPLLYRGEEIGALLLAPRPGEDGFSSADEHLLDGLARQAGVAAYAVRLTADLQHSRERLVTAREEERRRLRRDLHDGLGPALGSLPLKLDVAGDLVEEDPAAARELLRGLKAQSRSAVADIRRLVYELRPPALDELGLVGAVRETAAQHGANGLRTSVEAPETLPPLPAAVEVAAYRIVQEALTNVSRHAEARNCVVRLVLDRAGGVLRVEVSDHGQGLPTGHRPGVGLHSMRERAEELGGECVVKPGPAGGTRVSASLPVPDSSGRDEDLKPDA